VGSCEGLVAAMASYSKLPLWKKFAPGCLIPVTQSPKASGFITLAGDVEVEIRNGVRAVAVRNLKEAESAELLSQGIDIANLALDFFAGTGITAVNLGDVEEFHATWRRDESGIVIRLCHSYAMQFRMMAGGFIREGDGNLVLSPPFGEWHRALRYFRLSQSSSDLFDAFRNLYLALECLLNEVAPRKTRESEGRWLARALEHVYELIDVPTALGELDTGSCDSLHKEIWKSVRNPVFHAKDQDTSFLPLAISSRETVRINLLRCGMLCTALGEHLHGVRFLSSGVSVQAAKAAGDGVLTNCDIGITDDPSPFDPEQGELSPAGRPVMLIKARKVDEIDSLPGSRVRGRAFADEVVRQVGSVRRVATVTKDGLVGLVEVLDGTLNVDGADVVEVEWTLSAAGAALKRSYPS
jgi:hypothetical protein